MNWIKLVEICSPKQWKTVPQKDFTKNGYPLYGANGQIGYYSKYTHENPTICITCRGATCGTVNMTEPYSYINGNAMALDHLDEERINIDFLYYYLTFRGFEDVISGSAQPQITRTGLKPIEIPLFPMDEQLLIVKVLTTVMNILEKRNSQLQELDNLIQSIFMNMFSQDITDSEVIKLSEITNHISSGSTPRGGKKVYQEEGIPIIRSQDVLMNELDLTNVAYISEEIHDNMKRSKVKNRDVLLNITGASIGRTAVYYDEDDSANKNQHVASIRLNTNKILPEFLSYYFSTDYFQKIIQLESSGGTREALNYTQIGNFDIPTPSIKKQEKFVGYLEELASIREKMQLSLDEMNTLFNALMQKAFTGELV